MERKQDVVRWMELLSGVYNREDWVPEMYI